MGTRTRAERYLSEVLPKIYVIFEVGVIEDVHNALFLLAKRLGLRETLGRDRLFLVSEFDKGLMHHLAHSKISRLVIHQVLLSHSMKEVRGALPG